MGVLGKSQKRQREIKKIPARSRSSASFLLHKTSEQTFGFIKPEDFPAGDINKLNDLKKKNVTWEL